METVLFLYKVILEVFPMRLLIDSCASRLLLST